MSYYQQNLGKVETELNSPVLKNFSEKWKNQTFETAKEDPLKALDFLHQFKKQEMVRQEKAAAAAQAEAKQEHIQGIYRQYWQTEKMIKDCPSARPHFKDHLENLAKEMFQDKAFMAKLKVSDLDDAKRIEHLAVGKQQERLQEQERIQEHTHSISRDRGGLSL